MIAPSSFVSRAMIERYGILPERVKVIPRSIDVASFNREAVAYERIEYLQTLWNVSNSERIVFVPGRLVAENGQTTLIEAANLLIAGGERNIVFVLAGDARTDPKHVAALRERLSALGIDNFFRLAGPAPDMPAALAASDLVVVPAHTPPPLGRTVAEAQAIGRPVVTTTAGVLPENILCPPRMPDDLRTGWAVTPANAGELADAMATALALSPVEQESMAARARQFAEFMFSPQSVAESIRAVYTSLLSRDT